MSVPMYEARVRRYYQDFLPERTEQLEDPEMFFRQLAEQISEQVIATVDRLSTQASAPGQDYLARVGTLNTVQAQAQELVLQELLYSTPPETDEDSDELEQPSRQMADWSRDQQALGDRLSLDPAQDAEAIADWNSQHPHLIEMASWLQADHSGTPQEQMDRELELIYERSQQARPTR